jgi:FMN phosphatase YigB (HAD superfamily)
MKTWRTMKPQVVFFDLGQTLVTGADLSARRLLAERLGLDTRQTKRVGRLLMTLQQETPEALAAAVSAILPGKDAQRINSDLQTLWREQTACVREIPGATTLLRELKQMGAKVGVISNIWHPFYSGIRHNCPEMVNLLDYSCLSYRVGVKKPSPELFQVALETANAPAASCWMVGDSYELDLSPAAQVGMHTLWVLARPERESALLAEILRGDRPRPDWAVSKLEEVLAFFQFSGNARHFGAV